MSDDLNDQHYLHIEFIGDDCSEAVISGVGVSPEHAAIALHEIADAMAAKPDDVRYYKSVEEREAAHAAMVAEAEADHG